MEYPKVEFFTTHAKLEAGREQTVDVLIRITPPALSPDLTSRPNWKGRPDLNLSLVLDRSGSMEGEKMIRARDDGGVILIALLWILVAISVIALSFAREGFVEVAAARVGAQGVVGEPEAAFETRGHPGLAGVNVATEVHRASPPGSATVASTTA